MKLASMIDHTILKPEAGKEQVETICREAREYGFASVCVNSSYVPLCAELLRDTEVKVCTVIGFPLGAMSTAAKAAEARQAILDGAEELDMVIHIGMLKDGNNEYVEQDIHSVVEEARGKAAVKVIIETCLLSDKSLPAGEKGRSRLCENVHRILYRRCYSRGYCPYEENGWKGHESKGFRRNPHQGKGGGNEKGGS